MLCSVSLAANSSRGQPPGNRSWEPTGFTKPEFVARIKSSRPCSSCQINGIDTSTSGKGIVSIARWSISDGAGCGIGRISVIGRHRRRGGGVMGGSRNVSRRGGNEKMGSGFSSGTSRNVSGSSRKRSLRPVTPSLCIGTPSRNVGKRSRCIVKRSLFIARASRSIGTPSRCIGCASRSIGYRSRNIEDARRSTGKCPGRGGRGRMNGR